MTKFLFAVAAAALFASAGSAQETPVAVQPTTPTPVFIGSAGTPAVEYAPAAPARRGLFGRLRNRNAGTVTTMPSNTVVTPGPVIAPQPMPMPMPGVKPVGAITMPGEVVVASGTTDTNVLMPVAYTEPMTAQSTPARRGLFGRMRNR